MMLTATGNADLQLPLRQFRAQWYSFLLCGHVRFPCTPFPQDAFCSEPLSSTSALGELRSIEAPDPNNKVLLREQVFQVLRMLLEREGKIVTREEIKGRLWPNDTVVDFDRSINATIKALRRALGDSADNPRYIETLGRRGYRLMVMTEYMESAPGIAPGEVTAGRPLQPIPLTWEEGFALPRTRFHRGRWHGSGFQSRGSQDWAGW